MTWNDDDFVPVTGGDDLADDYIRDDVVDLSHLKVCSELDRHIVRLLSLHPQLRDHFRELDLSELDDSNKRDLLKSMNDILSAVARVRPQPDARCG